MRTCLSLFGRWASIDLVTFVFLLNSSPSGKLVGSVATPVAFTRKSVLPARSSLGTEIILALDATFGRCSYVEVLFDVWFFLEDCH